METNQPAATPSVSSTSSTVNRVKEFIKIFAPAADLSNDLSNINTLLDVIDNNPKLSSTLQPVVKEYVAEGKSIGSPLYGQIVALAPSTFTIQKQKTDILILDTQQEAISADNKIKAVRYSNKIIITDVNNSDASITTIELKQANEGISSLAFKPDDNNIIAVGFFKSIEIWDIKQQKVIYSIKLENNEDVISLAFSPINTNVLASGTAVSYKDKEKASKHIRVYDIGTKKIIAEIKPVFSMFILLFHPIISGILFSADEENNVIIWNYFSGKKIATIVSNLSIDSLYYDKKSNNLITQHWQDGMQVWDASILQNTLDFLKTLYGDAGRVKKFIFLDALFEYHAKMKTPYKLVGQARVMFNLLPAWLQQLLIERKLVE